MKIVTLENSTGYRRLNKINLKFPIRSIDFWDFLKSKGNVIVGTVTEEPNSITRPLKASFLLKTSIDESAFLWCLAHDQKRLEMRRGRGRRRGRRKERKRRRKKKIRRRVEEEEKEKKKEKRRKFGNVEEELKTNAHAKFCLFLFRFYLVDNFLFIWW